MKSVHALVPGSSSIGEAAQHVNAASVHTVAKILRALGTEMGSVYNTKGP